jgi:hypothetical protein
VVELEVPPVEPENEPATMEELLDQMPLEGADKS